MEEDAERSLMFVNSVESEHSDGHLPRVSETTERTVTKETAERTFTTVTIERTVTMETTERIGPFLWKQHRGQLLRKQQRGRFLWKQQRGQLGYYGNSSSRLLFLCFVAEEF